MISRFRKSALRRSPGHNEVTPETSQSVKDLCVSRDVDVLDLKLFEDDFDVWFAKAAFQYHLAMAIQKEHLGHAVVNPKDVFGQVEARYWKEPSRNMGGSGSFCSSKFELFSCISAARATKDDITLQVFMDQLSAQILSICRKLRTENVAELDADTSPRPSQIHCVATLGSNTDSSQSTKESGGGTDSNGESSNLCQENFERLGPVLAQNSMVLAQPVCLKCQRPVKYCTTNKTNLNGNASRPYFKCIPCDKFHSWADERGNNPKNPLCYCNKPSRGQVSGSKARSSGALHYVCSLGTCDFYQAAKNLKGVQIILGEELKNKLIELKLV